MAWRRNAGSVICRDPVLLVGVCVGLLVILLIGLWVRGKGSGIAVSGLVFFVRKPYYGLAELLLIAL